MKMAVHYNEDDFVFNDDVSTHFINLQNVPSNYRWYKNPTSKKKYVRCANEIKIKTSLKKITDICIEPFSSVCIMKNEKSNYFIAMAVGDIDLTGNKK